MRRIITVTILITLVCTSCKSKSSLAASAKSESNSTAVMTTNRLTLQDSLINFGKNYLRTPYRYGGNTPRGFDCSGFTSHVYGNFGYNLNRSSRDQAKQFPTIKKNDLLAGDLVFFEGRSQNRNVGHVGIVTQTKPNGEFDFIHASVQSGVTISSSTENYYASRYLRAGRVITNTSATFDRPPSVIASTVPVSGQKNSPSSGNTLPVSSTPTKNITEAVYHTVGRGDNIASISKKYDVPISTIQHLNNLTSKKIKRGQKLLIIEVVQVPFMPVAEIPKVDYTKNTGQQEKQFIALERQAKEEKRQPATIAPQQEIRQNSAPISQELEPQQIAEVIVTETKPLEKQVAEQTNTRHHKVGAGESLFSIAKKYNLTVEELKSLNNLVSNSINAGQMLIVNDASDIMVQTTGETANPRPTESVVHTVKKGDTLYSIARQYNCSVSDLRKWNVHLDDAIKIGEKVKISTP